MFKKEDYFLLSTLFELRNEMSQRQIQRYKRLTVKNHKEKWLNLSS